MSKTLTLGPVTLALPLESDGCHIVGPDRHYIGKAWPAELATLFAASPDLLLAAEALMDIMPHDDTLSLDDHARWAALRTAIARARGST